MNLNFKAIMVGFIVAICFAPFLDVLIFSIIGGLAVGLWVADKYQDGAMNALISIAIASGLFLAVNATIIYPTMLLTQPVETILLWIVCIFLGVLGSILGVFIRKMTINIQQSRSTSKLEEKGYLLCNECGGYYELKKGETPEDYEECECGGKLEYKGPEISAKSAKSGKEFGDLFAESSIWWRFIAIVVGAIIIFISGLLLHEQPFQLSLLVSVLLAGFVTGVIAGGSYQDGVFNSGGAGLLGGILIFLSNWYFEYVKVSMSFMELVLVSVMIIYGITGLFGGLIGIFARSFIIKKYEDKKLTRESKELTKIANIESNKKFEGLFKETSIWRRVIAVSSGVIIILVISTLFEGYLPCIVLLHSHISGLMILTYLFTLIIAGFATAFIAGESYKEGMINSAVAGLIGGILAFLLGGYLGWYLAEGNIPAYFMTSFIFNLILIDVTLSTVGGIINIYTKNRRTDTGTYTCDNCGNYYELPPGESAEDYDLKCDCDSNLTHAKKTSLLMLIIGYVFALSGGFIGLFIGLYLYTGNNPNAKFHGRNITVVAVVSMLMGVFLLILYPY